MPLRFFFTYFVFLLGFRCNYDFAKLWIFCVICNFNYDIARWDFYVAIDDGLVDVLSSFSSTFLTKRGLTLVIKI